MQLYRMIRGGTVADNVRCICGLNAPKTKTQHHSTRLHHVAIHKSLPLARAS